MTMLLLLSLAFGSPAWTAAKEARIRDLAQVHAFEPADAARVYTLVSTLARHAPSGELPPNLDALADGVATVARQDSRVVVTLHGGQGCLVLRLGEAPPRVWSAPHPWYDAHTGRLAGLMFDEGRARAVLFASTHRHLGDSTDVAHTTASGFHAATLALADSLYEPRFVQLHGFGPDHTDADVVLGGTQVGSLARILAPLGWQVVEGAQVPALAGRTNAQVRALTGRAPVAHLELSAALRKRLLEDAELRRGFREGLDAW